MSTMIPQLVHKIPSFVREDYPEFVQYIKDYLGWLEQDDNFLGIINDWQRNMEPSLEVTPYIDAMLTDLGFESGQNLAIDKSLLIHLLKDFYLSRGNEGSFRFLFRMLFNAEVEIRYPREFMLIPSYAEYGERHFIFTSANNIANFQALVTDIREDGGQVRGLTSGVVASIENIQIMHGSGTPYFRIEILRPSFEFRVGEAVTVSAGPTRITEFVRPVLDIEIQTPGFAYKTDEIVQVAGAKLNGNAAIDSVASGGVSEIEIVATGANHTVGDLIKAKTMTDGFGFSAEVTEVDAQGGILKSHVLNKGYNYTAIPEIYTNSVVPPMLRAKSKDIGAVRSIRMDNPFVDFDQVTISIDSVAGKECQLVARSVSRWSTKNWENDRGVIGTSATLLDSDRIQQFAYQIVSPIAAKQYDSFVKDYLHPVGYVRSSSYEIVSDLGLNMESGAPSIGSDIPYIFDADLALTLFSELDSSGAINSLVTSTFDDLVTHLAEPIIVV